MQTRVDKKQRNKRSTVTNAASQTRGDHSSVLRFVDNRPEAVQMRKLQGMASNHVQKDTFQFVDNRPEVIQVKKLQELTSDTSQIQRITQFQKAANEYSAKQEQPAQRKINSAVLPDRPRSGVENIPGCSMSDVEVRRKSSETARFNAPACVQGVGKIKNFSSMKTLQLKKQAQKKLSSDQLNVVGEFHDESGKRREAERSFAQEKKYGYWLENEFEAKGEKGDPDDFIVHARISYISENVDRYLESLRSKLEIYEEDYPKAGGNEERESETEAFLEILINSEEDDINNVQAMVRSLIMKLGEGSAQDLLKSRGFAMDIGGLPGQNSCLFNYREILEKYRDSYSLGDFALSQKYGMVNAQEGARGFRDMFRGKEKGTDKGEEKGTDKEKERDANKGKEKVLFFMNKIFEEYEKIKSFVGKYKTGYSFQDWSLYRSAQMHVIAVEGGQKKGIWKIGDSHAKDIETNDYIRGGEGKYTLVRKSDFDRYFGQIKV